MKVIFEDSRDQRIEIQTDDTYPLPRIGEIILVSVTQPKGTQTRIHGKVKYVHRTYVYKPDLQECVITITV